MVGNGRSDFAAELARVDADISILEGDALAPLVSAEKATRYLGRLYQRASLTGNLKALRDVEKALDQTLARLPDAGDLHLLKANLAFKLHRLNDVERELERAPYLLETSEGKALAADLAFQTGRYEAAKKQYQEALAGEPSWDTLSRLAHYESKLGTVAEADRLYAEAEDQLTAKQMRSYAWVELQRGLLDFAAGDLEAADEHYRKADRAYSGYWQVEEHRTELVAARGDLHEAAERYEKLATAVPKPELQQIAGKLRCLLGDAERGQDWYRRAESEFLDSASAGEVHYYHHLVDFYLHANDKPEAAALWARKDWELRDNFNTQSALALALHRCGQNEEALPLIERALASKVSDPHVSDTAARIYRALGRKWNGNGTSHAHPHFHVHHH